MNVLMISLADAVLREDPQQGNTALRLARYLKALREAEPNSTITLLVYTRRPAQTVQISDGLYAIPVTAPRVQALPILGQSAVKHLPSHLPPDMITAQDPFEAGLLGLWLSRRFDIPLEVQIHANFLSPYWLAEHPIWNRVRRAMARRILPRADAIRVVSSPIKQALVTQWGLPETRIAIIPVPVFYEANTAMATPPPKILSNPDHHLILFVGRLCPAKNLPGLFNVIEHVLDARSDVEFALIGDGPERDYAQQSAARIDAHHIHILGRVPYASIPDYYQQANALIFPSRHEGFGRVIIESYLHDTPVVATRCGGPEDIIIDGETGFLTAIEDMDHFAKRVLWLLDQQEAAAAMGEKGHHYVQRRFAPQPLIERMVSKWQQITQGERQ